MDRKKIAYLMLCLFLIYPASATSYFNTTADILLNLDNGESITLVMGQTFSNTTDPVIRIYNSTDMPASILEINSIGTQVKWDIAGNKTISGSSFKFNALIFTGVGTSGYLNTSIKTSYPNSEYVFKVDGVIDQTKTSDSDGYIWFNYSTWSTHVFQIASVNSIYAFSSASVSRHKIYKCQPSLVYATFSDYGNITNVQLVMTTHMTGAVETYNMTDLGGGIWGYAYGNNPDLDWGNKSITFSVYTADLAGTEDPDNYIFVYSDTCTGADIQGSANISLGLGHYTGQLQNNNDIVEWILMPYIDYWGYLFYVVMLFAIMGIIYMKNGRMNQVILIGFISLMTLGASGLIPIQFRSWILLLLAFVLGLAFWKIFKT